MVPDDFVVLDLHTLGLPATYAASETFNAPFYGGLAGHDRDIVEVMNLCNKQASVFNRRALLSSPEACNSPVVLDRILAVTHC